MRGIATATFVGIVLAAPAWGQQDAPGSVGGTNAPSLELLEFLGEFEDGSGTWIDPELLLEMLGDAQTESGDDG